MFYIIMCSVGVTVVMTAIQLYFDYRVELHRIAQQLEIIQGSSLPSLSNALWTADEQLIARQLRDMLSLPDLQYLEVHEDDGVTVSVGDPTAQRILSKRYALTYRHPRTQQEISLGTFRVDVNLGGVYQRLWNKALVIFGTKMIETFVAAACIFLIFYLIAGQHLTALAQHARSLTPERLDTPITLQRRPKRRPDELDDLVIAINAMSRTIYRQMTALRQSEEKYRVLFESFPLGITISDCAGKIIETNAIAESIVGITREDHAQRSLDGQEWKIFRPDGNPMPPEEFASVKALAEHRKIDGMEMGILLPNGDMTWLSVTAAPIPLEGYGVAIAYGDITARKRAEEEIRTLNMELETRVARRTAALEAANKELRDFAYVASHDLKAPLRGISRLAFWLTHDYADVIDEKGRDMATLLINRVKRLDTLIDGMLEYSRVGRVEEEFGSVNLNALLPEIVDSLAAPDHIHVLIGSNLPIITGDRTRFFQVFQNLLSNAIRYMDKTEGNVLVECADDGAYWRFTVSDNGPGIEKRHYDRNFHIFQTLAPRDRMESTGMGLAIVKKIIELYGGKIWLESEPGKGCAFQFTLPKTMPLPADHEGKG